jgi:hypothetical protein
MIGVFTGYLVSVLLGAAIAYAWVDHSEFLDNVSMSEWCDSVLKMKTNASEVSFVWYCYNATNFWEFAAGFGTVIFVGAVVIALMTKAVSNYFGISK